MRSVIFSLCLLALITATVLFCAWQTPRKIRPVALALSTLTQGEQQTLVHRTRALLAEWESMQPLLSLWVSERQTEAITADLRLLCTQAETGDENGMERTLSLLSHRLDQLSRFDVWSLSGIL